MRGLLTVRRDGWRYTVARLLIGVSSAQRVTAVERSGQPIVCAGWWLLDEIAATAGVFVDDVLRHTDSEPDVRPETDGLTVIVAVTHGCDAPACVRDADEVLGAVSELHIVHALTRVWGNTPMREGKVVWAVIGPENRP